MGVNGSDILALVNTSGDNQNPVFEEVAGQRNYTEQRESGTIDFSSKSDDAFASTRPGRITGSVTLENLYEIGDSGFLALKAAQASRQPILLQRSENGIPVEEALFYVTSLQLAGPDNEASTNSVTLSQDGPWSAV
ncbi:MAG: phage tail tube protein [Planctomycetota bacterium]